MATCVIFLYPNVLIQNSPNLFLLSTALLPSSMHVMYLFITSIVCCLSHRPPIKERNHCFCCGCLLMYPQNLEDLGHVEGTH